MKREWLTLTRDIGSLLVGFGGLIHQEYFLGHAIEGLLVVYTALLAVPGAAGIVSLRRNGTTEQSSESAEVASS